QAAARNARLVVVRKEAPLELAFGSRQQIADLGVELQAAAAHVARLERRVEVRRDVQVVRNRDVEAGAVALGEVRREETALASIVDREREVWRIEDRHALELELHPARPAETPVDVELDVGCEQLPRAVAFGARREEDRRHVERALDAADRDLARGASSGPSEDVESGLAEIDALIALVEDRVGAEHRDRGISVAHATFDLDTPRLRVDRRPLAADLAVAVADRDVVRHLRAGR